MSDIPASILASMAPVLIGHLDGDFDRGRAVVGVEHATQTWRGDVESPRLRVPTRGDPSLASNVQLRRGHAKVEVDLDAVAARYADIQAGRAPVGAAMSSGSLAPLPRGYGDRPAPYYSLRYHLPPVYAAGTEGL